MGIIFYQDMQKMLRHVYHHEGKERGRKYFKVTRHKWNLTNGNRSNSKTAVLQNVIAIRPSVSLAILPWI